MKRELWETLAEILEAASAHDLPGEQMRITRLSLDLPMEIDLPKTNDAFVFRGDAPRTRWDAGFKPPLGRLRIRLEETGHGQS